LFALTGSREHVKQESGFSLLCFILCFSRLSDKTVFAGLAGIGSISSVHHYMPLQVIFFDEYLFTNLAKVRLFSNVNHIVFL